MPPAHCASGLSSPLSPWLAGPNRGATVCGRQGGRTSVRTVHTSRTIGHKRLVADCSDRAWRRGGLRGAEIETHASSHDARPLHSSHLALSRVIASDRANICEAKRRTRPPVPPHDSLDGHRTGSLLPMHKPSPPSHCGLASVTVDGGFAVTCHAPLPPDRGPAVRGQTPHEIVWAVRGCAHTHILQEWILRARARQSRRPR